MWEVSNKIVLITGSSRGLGRALCIAFAQAGAKVIAFARRSSELNKLEKDISGKGYPSLIVEGDVRNEQNISQAVEQALKHFGKIDVLINNASILGPRVQIAEYPSEIWREVLDVNATGAFLVTKAVLPIMLSHSTGSIINVSSSVGRHGRANWGAYAVSKFAIEGFTQVLADELQGTGVRVNSVNPGAMATEMRRQAYPHEDQSKLAKPEEVLDIFFYLASDASRDINGQTFDAQTFRRNM